MATDMLTESDKQSRASSGGVSQPPTAEGTENQREVRRIIAAARSARVSSRGAWILSLLTAGLMWAAFTPLDWGPLGWLCLVPLMLLVRLPQRTAWMYAAIYTSGLANTLATLQWMRLGDPSMYYAWAALAVYLACYFPVFVMLSRVALHRFRIPLVAAAPLVWVGLEFARAHLMTGFAWYYLGHSQYRWIELIQISDLLGAYGVSFVVAAAAAAIAGVVPTLWLVKLGLLRTSAADANARRSAAEDAVPSKTSNRFGIHSPAAGVAVALLLFASTLTYGYVRRAQANFEPGPRVALVQGNFTSSLKHDPHQRSEIFRKHVALTGRAVSHQPDLIVWPETMFRWPLMEASPEMSAADLERVIPQVPPERWRDPTVHRALADESQKANAAMVLGLEGWIADPQQFRRFNSAVLVTPELGIRQRYDKVHRVPFGEYIPLQNELPWLHVFTPFSSDYGIAAGAGPKLFRFRDWSLVPVICFEDTVPHLVRQFVQSGTDQGSDGTADCIVNLTNDGWFHGSSELDQHLITAAFRSVECRTPMVRAVNTGISAVIDGDGVIRTPEVFIDGDNLGRSTLVDPETGRWRKQLNAVVVDTVPLDDRRSVYVQTGDWFAGGCAGFCVFLGLGPLVIRRRNPRA